MHRFTNTSFGTKIVVLLWLIWACCETASVILLRGDALPQLEFGGSDNVPSGRYDSTIK